MINDMHDLLEAVFDISDIFSHMILLMIPVSSSARFIYSSTSSISCCDSGSVTRGFSSKAEYK